MRIVLVTWSSLFYAAVRASGHELVGLLHGLVRRPSWRRRLRLRLQRLAPEIPLPDHARSQKLPVLETDDINSPRSVAWIEALKPDILLVFGWPQVIRPPVLALPKAAALNCHSALLPKYRGPQPVESVLYAGEAETGVTFHFMSEKLDAGDIIWQQSVPITDADNFRTLHDRCQSVAVSALREVLDSIADGTCHRKPQKQEEQTFVPKLEPEQWFINWQRPARGIHNLVRALAPYRRARAYHEGRLVTFGLSALLSEEPAPGEPGQILYTAPNAIVVACRPGVIYLWDPAAPDGQRHIAERLRPGTILT